MDLENSLPDFKAYHKATGNETMWYWHVDISGDQWIRIKNPNINPYIYDQLSFDKSIQ